MSLVTTTTPLSWVPDYNTQISLLDFLFQINCHVGISKRIQKLLVCKWLETPDIPKGKSVPQWIGLIPSILILRNLTAQVQGQRTWSRILFWTSHLSGPHSAVLILECFTKCLNIVHGIQVGQRFRLLRG